MTDLTDKLTLYKKCYHQQKKLRIRQEEINRKLNERIAELVKKPTLDDMLGELKAMQPPLDEEPSTEDTIRMLFGSEPPLAERVEEQYDYKRMVEWICSEAGQKGKGHKTVRVALHKQFGYGKEERLANRGYKSKEPTNNLVRTDMVCPRTGISVATFRAT